MIIFPYDLQIFKDLYFQGPKDYSCYSTGKFEDAVMQKSVYLS